MKVYYSFIFLLLLPLALFAQTRGDELSRQITNAKSDLEKLALYKDVIYDYEQTNEDSAIFYARQGFELFTKDNYKIGQGWMISDLSDIDDDHGREDLARKRSIYALKLFNEEHYTNGIAEVNNGLGVIEAKAGNFESAISYFMSALRSFESLRSDIGVMRQYTNLAIAYEHYQDSSKALSYLRMADSISKKLPMSDAVINLYNDIGAYYSDRGDTVSALKYFKQGLEKSNKPEYFVVHLSCLINAGQMYYRFGQKEQGVQYLKDALKIAKEHNLPEEEANTLTDLADILSETDKAKAHAYLVDALVISKNIQNKPLQVVIYQAMEDLYKSENDYKSAYEIQEKRRVIVDSIFNINKSMEIASIGAIHDLEKSNMKVLELEELSTRNARKSNIIICIASFAMVAMIVLIIFYRKTVLLNKQLIKHELELKNMNAMKDKLFSVIGHDLKGPIARIPSVIEIYEDKETSEEERKYLLDNLKEHTKASVDTLNKLLFWGQSLVKGITLNQVKFHPKHYIHASIELKKAAAADKKITIADNVPEDIYVFADATHFDFIIRNLVANAIKYTHNSGRIEINADSSTRPGFTVFSVKDNGVGISKELLPHIFNPSYSAPGTANELGTGIGLMLCKEFVTQNGGEIWVESEAGKGASFFFSVKNAV